MLYVHEILTIVPWTEETFWTLLGSDYLPEAQQNGLRLVGLFKVGIRYSENYALWEVDDWATLDRLQEFHDKDWWIKAWKLESIQYRTDWVRRILEPAPFSPTLAQSGKVITSPPSTYTAWRGLTPAKPTSISKQLGKS